MESLNWLILQRIYLVWLSYSYCFIFDYNYSSFALRLQTSQHLILDLLYLKQWKAAKVRAKRINQNLEIFIGNTCPFNRPVRSQGQDNYLLQVCEQFYTYSFIKLIANLGGNVGLFLGVSFFTFIDEMLLFMLKSLKIKV